jgi:regulatory protein
MRNRTYKKSFREIPKVTVETPRAQEKTWNAVLRMLTRKDYARPEVIKKLKPRYELALIEVALEKATRYGYLKDNETIASAYSKMYDRQNRGQRYIEQKLKSKGLVAPKIESENEVDKCLRALEKKLKNVADLRSPQARQKLTRHLVGRGFSYSTIQSAMTKAAESK